MLIAGEPVDDVAIFGCVCGESGAHVECIELMPLLLEVFILLAVETAVLPVEAAAADVVAFVLTLLLMLPTPRLLLLLLVLLLPSVCTAVV